jgi:hypothetical protein
MTPLARWLELLRHDLEVGLRTRRFLMLAVLFMGAAALVGGAGILVLNAIEAQVIEAMGLPTGPDGQLLPEVREQIVAEVGDRVSDQLGDRAPALTSSVVALVGFWCMRAALPFFVLLAFSDIISGDLRRRSLCYDTLRTSRTAWLTARFASQTLLALGLVALTFGALFVAGSLALQSWPLTDALAAWASASVRLVPYLVLCMTLVTLVSCTTSSATVSLVRTFGFGLLWFVGLFIVDAVAEAKVEGAAATVMHHLDVLNPAVHASRLWMRDAVEAGGASTALLLMSGVLLATAAVVLSRRNL